MSTQQLPPDLARAGRALAQVSRETVASATGFTVEQLRQFELSEVSITADENLALRRALEHYGVEFFPDDEHGGYGVRRKFGVTSSARVENWEDEGGVPGEDDI